MTMFSPVSLKSIADMLGAELLGDPTAEVHSVATLGTATSGQITYLYQQKFLPALATAQATAVIVSKSLDPKAGEGQNLLIVADARIAFFDLIDRLVQPKKESGELHPSAHIGVDAVLGKNVTVYPGVFIGDRARVGDNTVIYPNSVIGDDAVIGEDTLMYAGCVLYDRSIIGNRCVIGANTVIGSDGMGFIQQNGKHRKIPHMGHVVIEDDVEIGACCAIDRGTLDVTKIAAGCKLDNFVHIAHNASVGEDNIMLAYAGLSGSSETGKGCTLLARSGVGPGKKVFPGTLLMQASNMVIDNDTGGVWRGDIARPHSEYLKATAGIYYIEKLRKRVKELEKKAAEEK